MSGKNVLGQEVSVDEQGLERVEDADAEPERTQFRPTVEMRTQAKVDANHPDVGFHGLTLEAEEKAMAREAEKARTRERWDRRQESDREARSRQVATKGSQERHDTFHERAGSVDPWKVPDSDPREALSREELADVNREAKRLPSKLDGWTSAAISRQLAGKVADGTGLMAAVIGVVEELERMPGTVTPIAEIGEVPDREVTIDGRWIEDWEPNSPAIQQVGLLEDESGRVKVTSWVKSDQAMLEEGERVRLHNVAKSWHDGRVSAALTGRSHVSFPDRDDWWDA